MDNRKENLRIVSRTINNLNRENVPYNIKQRTLASDKVVFDTRLQVNYVTHHLGTFSTEKRALILVERAIQNVINGVGYIEAIKRRGRWYPLERIKINY